MTLSLLLLLAVAAQAGDALPEGAVGVVSQAQGEVRLQVGEGYAPVNAGQPLREGDRLLVLGDAKASLTFLDGCEITTEDSSLIAVGATCESTTVNTPNAGMGAAQAVAVGVGIGAAAVVLEDILLDNTDQPVSP